MRQNVILVSETSSLNLVEKLCRENPVWIADVGAHAPLRAARGGVTLPLTWYALRNSEKPGDAALRIIEALDQHYNAMAQEVGYDTLWIIGLPFSPDHLAKIKPFGFRSVAPTLGGCLACK